jgi:hypothetical protein
MDGKSFLLGYLSGMLIASFAWVGWLEIVR